MGPIQSLEDLEHFKQKVLSEKKKRAEQGYVDIVVSMGSCGMAAGACDTYEAAKQLVYRKKIDKVKISETGCIGLCEEEPVVEVHTSDGHKTTYGHVTPDVMGRIIEEHILAGKVVQDHVINY
jgi:NADP-reducing hydrogenase subunit HndB